MSDMLKTEKCIECGEKAEIWTGFVLAKEKRALGYVKVKIAAGYCEKCFDYKLETSEEKYYDPEKMGICLPLFL